MRLSLLAAASLAGVALSQLQDLPACARTCVTGFTSGDKIGNCNGLNIPCICGSSSFLSDIACCLAGACSVDDQKKATDFALTFCKAAGVTGLPTAVSCTTGTAAQTGSSTHSSGTETTTSGPAATTTSGPATTTSGPATTTSGPASTSGSAKTSGSTSSGTAAPATVQSQSGSATASPSVSTTRNAGAQHTAGMGAGLVGGVAALAAALL